MKSCRNCENSRHDGYYHIRLICRLNNRVVVPYSMSDKENKASDTSARNIAKTCHAYTPEGESK
jgi:hypothetical protein